MEIELAWSSIFKIFAMGFLTYVIAPVLLTIRDSVVWWAIYKFLYTEKVRDIMSQYCLDRAWVDHAGITPFRIYGMGKEQRFYLGEREVEREVFFGQKEVWERLSTKTAQQGAYLKNIEKRIDRLLKHYKQEDGNPLRDNRASLYQGFKRSFTDEGSECNKSSQKDAQTTRASA
ncbi:hypothetical protein [Halomonas salipaludis]|uniref:hypothetical protein n=1 Tax=Halomonas salipaludis TaxID=2032625 RepID=UPI00114107FE|nr:hypothetical protein [Halomonas salipaludis]